MASALESQVTSAPSHRTAAPWLSIGLLSLAATSLGPALLGKVRLYEERALWWLAAACLLAVAAALVSRVSWAGKTVAIGMMGAGLAVSFWVLLTERPGSWGDAQWVWFGSVQHQKVPPLSQPGLLFDSSRKAELRAKRQVLVDEQKMIRGAMQGISHLFDQTALAERDFLIQKEIDAIDAAMRATRFQIFVLIMGACALVALLPWRIARIAGFCAVLAIFFGIGVWVIRTDDKPFIDV